MVKDSEDCSSILKVVEAQDDFNKKLESTSSKKKSKFLLRLQGLATAVCRHDCFMKTLVSKYPEHWSLMAALFFTLLVDDKWFPDMLGYDVVCRFYKYLLATFPHLSKHMIFFVGALHLMAHSLECQKNFSSYRVWQWGAVHGEGVERANRLLREYANALKSMTIAHYVDTLFHAERSWNVRKELLMPGMSQC